MSTDQPEAIDSNKSRYRFLFLDGIRGLAAFYVVLFHFHAQFGAGAPLGVPLSTVVSTLTSWMGYGHYAVDVFIVLSGYSLMVPVARSEDLPPSPLPKGNGIKNRNPSPATPVGEQIRGEKGSRSLTSVPGGVGAYFKRRARRILPPYYAALVLALLPIAVSHLLIHLHHRPDPTLRADLAPVDIAAHLLLLHNLNPAWYIHYDPPIWTVATEWQIYFFLPFVLLPIWRRFGTIAMVLAGFVLTVPIHYIAPAGRNLDCACPWFLGLFALGAAGAVVNFRHRVNRKWSIGTAAGFWVVSILVLGLFPGLALNPNWYVDALVGLSTAALIVCCTEISLHGAGRPVVLRILESRPVVVLGVFSYSLYLVHDIVLIAMMRNVVRHHWRWMMSMPVLFLVEIPVVLVLSYLFHLAFERRFMPGHPRSVDKAARAAAVSPAP